MAKKKNTSVSNSKYSRYEKNDNKSKKGNKKNLDVNISDIEDLDSTKNLDISFVDGNFNKKVVEQKTEILDVYEINKANETFNETLKEQKDRKNAGVFTLGLLGVCLILLVFIICHFCIVDHNKERIVEKEIIKEVIVPDDNYIFLGDSITEWYDLEEYYEELPVVNSGNVGYTTSDILEKMDKLVYQYNPSKVFILIGVNDLEFEINNDDIVNNIKKIISNIRENRPYSKIYLESIYPINDSDSDKISDMIHNGHRKNIDIVEINTILTNYAKENNITYIDVYSELVDENGLLKLDYTKDGLHLSDKGYEVVTDVLEDYIKE